MRLQYINSITTHGRRVWSLALEGKDDLERFKALNWGLRTWDTWNWNDCLPREIHVNDKQSVFHWGDRRFGDDWPARHRSRPKEAVSAAKCFRSGEAGGRDFQNTPAKNETRVNSILINDYLWILNQSGWQETHIFQAPLSSERFKANVVSAMQKKKIIGVTSRYVIILKKKQVFKPNQD